MAGVWCMLSYRRKNGHSTFPHTHMVYLYLFYHHGLAANRVFYCGILDEHEAVYSVGQAEPIEVFVNGQW